ncbi:MAG: L,D-transpeptidase family protein [Bacteroidales bacterium]|nr:L,D-transpeptidase family protein [Bacteroidales bacterium]
MKPNHSTLYVFLLLLLTLTGCHRKGQLENTPQWSAFQKYYNEKDYSEFFNHYISSLADGELMFASPTKDFYQKQPERIWTANGFQENLVNDLLSVLGKSEEHGLPVEMFSFQNVNTDIALIQSEKITSSEQLFGVLARLETTLTNSYLLYAKSMAYGATDPVEMNGGKWLYEIDSMPPTFIPTALEQSSHAASYLTSLQPTDSVYLALQSELRKYLAIKDVVFDSIPFIAADSNHYAKNLHLVGERLKTLKEIPEDYVPVDTLNRTLMMAIHTFRENRGLPRSRKLDEETFLELNRQPQYYIDKLSANLERLRWKTKRKKGSDFVAVNIPDFTLEARSADTLALRMKIVCGKYNRKSNSDSLRVNGILKALKTETPLLYSEINYIALNPEWKIPYSIIKDEYYYKMVRNNMGVVKKEKLFVVDSRTKKEVLPETINWKKVSPKNIPYQLIQSSGPHNALGRVKFNINNTESVYLHDTNNKGAFSHRRRAFSHGCVRVQQPFELTELLLMMNDYDSTRLEQVMIILGNEPVSEDGEKFLEEYTQKEEEYFKNLAPEDTVFYRPLRPTNVHLKKVMPVFIEYYTCFIGPNGNVHYRPDVYEKERNILNRLQSMKK